MLLKGENLSSSEGFPGEEDCFIEEREVFLESHAPHPFPLERLLVQPQGNVLAVDPQVHGKLFCTPKLGPSNDMLAKSTGIEKARKSKKPWFAHGVSKTL